MTTRSESPQALRPKANSGASASRRLLVGLPAALVAILAATPILFAQIGAQKAGSYVVPSSLRRARNLPLNLSASPQGSQPSGTASSQAETSPTPTSALSHDLSGVWMQYPEGVVKGVPGMNAIDESLRPPLTPWGQSKYDAAFAMQGPRAAAGKENAPTLHCDPDGPPRVLNLPNPFEIIQIPGRMFMFYELGHVWRTIWTDGRPLPKDPDPTWLGYSVGKWEGDTFVVDTIGFNDKAWVDVYGNPRSDKMHLTERYRRVNQDTLEMQIIMDDPKAYTKPWVNPPKLHKLEPGWEIAEWFCIVDEENAYSEAIRKPAAIAPEKK